MIKPTIGRIVLIYRPEADTNQFEAAMITHINASGTIDVAGFGGGNHKGATFALQNLELRQDNVADDPEIDYERVKLLGDKPFACWMPYQRQSQAREDELAAQVPGQR